MALGADAQVTTTWTGSVNTTWDNAGNWNNGVPTSIDDAIIASATNQPSNYLSAPVCDDLTIQPGASMSLGNNEDLTVSGALQLTGTLTGDSSSDIIVAGDWINSGTFTANGSRVEVSATGAFGGSTASVFDELVISGGTRTATQTFTVNGDVTVEGGVSLVLNGSSYTVTGDWISSAASASVTGTGTIEFTGAGSLKTGSNSVPNVLISLGARTIDLSSTATVAGDLDMTGGSLQILDGATLNVNGDADLSVGTFGFTNSFAGDEVFDVDGDCSITATAGTFDSESIIRCGGDWTSTGAFTPAGGTVELDGGTTANVGGVPDLINLHIVSGTKTITTTASIASDLTVDSGATLTTNAALDIDGKVILGSTATWNLGASTHTVAGNWSSAGGSATGAGTIHFDDAGGGGLVTGAGTIANVTISAGTRSANDTLISGDLTMTGGALSILDNQSIKVGGVASLTAGTLTFNDTLAGNEILDVDGNCTITATSGGSSANTLIRCGGDWSSTSAFTLADGTIELDESSVATVGGTTPAFPNLHIVSGTKTVSAVSTISGDLTVDSGATLDTDAALDIAGGVTLGDNTASWDIGASTHTVGDSWTSTGASATGAGTIHFDGTGGGLDTGGGTIANALISSGTYAVQSSTITGDLDVTAGSIDLQNNQTLAVQGDAGLTGGTIAFVNSTAGNEILDVDGNLTLTMTSVGTSTETLVRCAGDYTSSAAFAPAMGLFELDGGTSATVSGVGTNFPNLTVVSGVKTVSDAVAISGDVEVANGATLDTDAALDIGGKVLLGDNTALWDIGTSTHQISGNFTSSGASAVGSGTIEFDAAGGLITGGGTIASVSIIGGDRSVLNSDVLGDLAMTAGGLILFDNQTLTVSGDLTLTAGTLTFTDTTAGVETIDVEGNATITAANGGTSANTLIEVAGDWSSSAAWTPTDGLVRLDGASPTTVGGGGPVFHDLALTSSSKQFLSATTVNGDLDIAALTTLDADAALDIEGDVSLTGTSIFDTGVDTHTIAGDFLTAGGSATGTGTLQFDGTGILETLGGSVPNVLNSAGFRLCNDSSITGSLSMTAGGITIGDNQTVTVGGDLTLTAGQLTFSDSTAGVETLDVGGDASVDASAGNHNANSFLQVAGNWTSSGSYSPTGGTVQLDGGTVATCGGSPVFWDLEITSGTKTVTAAGQVQNQLDVLDGATLDTDASLDIDGSVVLGGATALWDVGAVTHTVAGSWTSSGADASGAGTIQFDGPGTLLPTTGDMPNVLISSGDRICFGTNIVGNLTVSGGGIVVENDRAVSVSGDASFNAGTISWNGDGLGTQEGFDVEGNVTALSTVLSESADSVIFCGGNWSSDASFSPALGLVELDGGSAASISGTGTVFANLIVRSGTKTLLADAQVVVDLEIVDGQSVVSGAAWNVDGDVILGDATAQWDLGTFSHTVAGDWSSTGADAIGTGSIIFDGTGILQTNPGSISNASNSLGFRLIQDSTITGDLSMTGGGITMADNQTLTVQGDVSFDGGQLTFSDSTAGIELIDIEGNAHVEATAGTHSSNSVIQCAGNWSGNSGYSPTAGLVELDGAGATTVSGLGGGLDPTFNRFTVSGGPKTASNSFTLDANVVTISGGSSLDLGGFTVGLPSAAITLNGDLSVGAGGDLRLGSTAALTVAAPGQLNVIGAIGNPATVSGYAGGGYIVNVVGTIAASQFCFEDMGVAGIIINNSATIAAAPNDLRAGKFSNPSPTAGSVMLDIERPSDTEFRYVDFNGVGTGTFNVRVLSGSMITFVNSGGDFSGPAFENDPFNLVDWTTEGSVLTSYILTPGADQMTLDWTTSVEIDVTDFVIKRATSMGGPFTELTTIPAVGPSSYQYVDFAVTPTQLYVYQLCERLVVGGDQLLDTKKGKPWSASPPANFLTVGPGGSFADIQSALAAAGGVTNPMVVIEPGTYASFTVNPVGPAGTIRIFGDGTGTVTIDTTTGPVEVLNMGFFNNVEMGNMEIGSGTSGNTGLLIQNNLGVVVVDELIVHGGGTGIPGVDVDNSQRVAFQKCDIDGDVGMVVQNGSDVVASKGTLDDLEVLSASSVRTLELTTVSTVLGGSSLTEYLGVMPDIDMPEFVTIGAPFSIDISGVPGAIYSVLLSTDFLWLDLVGTADMVGLGNLVPGTVLFGGAIPGGGSQTLPNTMPESGAFFGFPLVFQMIHIDTGTLEVRWSNVTTLTGKH